ncbi:uncharacterized protein L3040_001809 [Drepanopeziza brunnea f. sp. 'multigermtubi']|uniref:DUF500 domain protein n=1 Tax=Marssonina brunnea f. sp. multigermtubi (strain MB_m1) TaxID=1072389 RepID=K1WSN7_MARBU|nr:DUF500 domain protein [Drepanopeziza brunnea f. sp. 'multigermtubi' MB_m1]EKD15437.1 DUF500 domain protein [Drepanopeziza brunnea f. sp. 'multigermtubi' MB_m1]KAJ5052049.1 hypothetical protein L3040_001809 [Drepanopeziza brunnea f. sp. 'multigermtubi']
MGRSVQAVQKECDKAAQILNSFVSKEKIPKVVMSNAKGVAIFSSVRAGFGLSGSVGSGVVLARLPDGSWSPPSAFSVRSGGVGFVAGIDMYECVCVLNTEDAVKLFSGNELKLGGEIALSVGPIGGTADMKPVWTYTKSNGLYGSVALDGTSIKQKTEDNDVFYGARPTTAQILKGDVQRQVGDHLWPAGADQLMGVLRLAEGKSATSTASAEPAPAAE